MVSDDSDKKDEEFKLSDDDAAALDTVDQLPLSIIPLQSKTLRKAKLLKNSKLETVVEMYSDPLTGSLQIPTDDKLTEALGIGNSEAAENDKLIIQQLSQLESFDIYSMRSSLQRIGLDLELPDEALQLSDTMKKSLSRYSRAFTMPLLQKIFGVDSDALEQTGGDLNKLFQNPDKQLVKQNLLQLSENTGIPLQEIPTFIQNYSDIYQSVSYFRYTYDAINDEIDRFLVWIELVINHKDIASTPQTQKICRQVEKNMRYVLVSLRERFDLFTKSFTVFWSDINAQSFAQLRRDVTENYESIGHVLCAVVVKINTWSEQFPFNDAGSPNKRAKFTMTELAPGIEGVKRTEEAARATLGLPQLKI